MPRKGPAVRRDIEPDPVYQNVLVTQLINKVRHGNMVLRGDTLYVLEVEPAGYAYYAVNEAEKTAKVNIVEVLGFGAFGRVYIAGEEAEVVEARTTVEARLASLGGREIAAGAARI